MSRRDDRPSRRRLGLKRETIRALSASDLGRVAGGWTESWGCGESAVCADSAVCVTADCGYSAGSRYC